MILFSLTSFSTFLFSPETCSGAGSALLRLASAGIKFRYPSRGLVSHLTLSTLKSDGITADKKDLDQVEFNILKLLRDELGGKSLVGSINNEYMKKHGEPLRSKEYGFKNLKLMLTSLKSVRVQGGVDDTQPLVKLLNHAKLPTATSQVCSNEQEADPVTSINPSEAFAGPLVVHSEIESLASILPSDLAASLNKEAEAESITEIVMDLGRSCYIWKDGNRVPLGCPNRLTTQANLETVIASLGKIGSGNRAGIEGQLHRASVIRNSEGRVVGLTLRVGRHVAGGTFLISDLLRSKANILFLGIPGTGKTTIIREVSRVLSENENVIIIDTSSEIAGTGDIPHAAVAKSRRMFVRSLDEQRNVMIECIQNHRPEVLVIDEIGRLSEAEAARTAVSRGVRLIASAHGSFRSLLQDPETKGLVGGLSSVIWGDVSAQEWQSNRGEEMMRKLRSERSAKPVFDVVVELGTSDTGLKCTVIKNTAEAVDCILDGRHYSVEKRCWDGKSRFFSVAFESH